MNRRGECSSCGQVKSYLSEDKETWGICEICLAKPKPRWWIWFRKHILTYLVP